MTPEEKKRFDQSYDRELKRKEELDAYLEITKNINSLLTIHRLMSEMGQLVSSLARLCEYDSSERTRLVFEDCCDDVARHMAMVEIYCQLFKVNFRSFKSFYYDLKDRLLEELREEARKMGKTDGK